MKDSKHLKNLIFDLGNVILDVDPKLTIDAFKLLGISNPETSYDLATENGLFIDFELGNISDTEFRNKLASYTNKEISDQEINIAWNAMLYPIQQKRMNLLFELKKHYNLYLLSNTNNIHYQDYSKKHPGIFDLKDSILFKKLYFSHFLNMRKPNLEIFQFVLNDAQILPEETLFFDDLKQNIDAAEQLGIHNYQVSKTNDLIKYFSVI